MLCALACAAGCKGPDRAERTERSGLAPFYRSASNPEGTSHGTGVFFNAYRSDVTPEDRYTHLVPFYFHSRGPEEKELELLLPLYYFQKKTLWENRFLLFLGGRKRGAKEEFYPFFPLVRFTRYEGQDERRGLYVFPLVEAERDGARRHWKFLDCMGLFHLLDMELGIPRMDGSRGMKFSFFDLLGMVRLAAGRNAGGWEDFELATLLSSEKISLFQRHWQRDGGNRGRTVFFPVYWHLKDEAGEAIHLWPLVGHWRGRDGTVTWHAIYPLLRWERNKAAGRWAVGVPWPILYFMGDRAGRHDRRVLPLFWDARWEHARFFMLFPLYADYGKDNGYDRRFYTPLLSVFEDGKKGKRGFDFLFPLAAHTRSSTEAHDRLIPLFWRTAGENKSLLVVTPLFWSHRGEQGYALDLLFPLYARFGWGEDDRTHSLIPVIKLVADRPERAVPGRFQADLLWPLAGYGTRPGRTVSWFFPLFKHVNDRQRDTVEWGFLADIFDLKVVESRKTFTFLWLLPISWGGGAQPESKER